MTFIHRTLLAIALATALPAAAQSTGAMSEEDRTIAEEEARLEAEEAAAAGAAPAAERDPTAPDALCRNFLGIIARDNVMVADNTLNLPRVLASPASTAGNTLFLAPDRDFFLDAITMSLTGTVGVENYAGSTRTNPASMCPKSSSNATSGGCLNQSGGVIQQSISATFSGSGTGSQRFSPATCSCHSCSRG